MDPENNTPLPPKPEKPVYTTADTAYAWLSLLLSFLFCQSLPVTEYPLGGFLLIVVLFVSAFVILRVKKQKLTPVCILSALSSLVIGAALLLTNTVFLIKLSFAYGVANYFFFLYAAFGNRVEEGFSDYIYMDFLRALLLLPFGSLGAIFPALGSRSSRNFSGHLLKILFGIAIAIIPTCLVFVFLAYDRDFLNLLDSLFSVDIEAVSRAIRSLVFTLPLSMYAFGLYAAAKRKNPILQTSAENCKNTLKRMQILPQLTALVAVLPILFLYTIFFLSQWKYYVSGFTGVLPENFSYANYARQGFFDLCCVSVINVIIIVLLVLLMRRNSNGISVILKVIATLFCFCTLVLISTAVAKLCMYIRYYGLTPKRIYAMWLMALIAAVFLLIALGQFLRRFKTVALCFTVAVVMFAGLAVCNVDALCAQYNADRYLSGTLETFDADAMSELGDSAVPALVRVEQEMDPQADPQLYRQLRRLLEAKASRHWDSSESFFSFSIPAAQAKAALKDYLP